jgi:DNA-binding FadR family transcriptional regulator
VEDEGRLEDTYHGLLRPVEVRSATDVTFERLQTLIMSGRLKAGDRLPSEPELARALRVGRSTVREAKKALMAQGLLESRGKLGSFVTAERVTAADIAEMRGTIERLKVGFQRNEPEVWTLMVDFHRNIVKASGNRVLVSVFDLIARLIRLHQVPYYQSIADPQSELRSHQELLDLVEQRSPEAAATAMMRHLEEAEQLRNEALENVEGKDDST